MANLGDLMALELVPAVILKPGGKMARQEPSSILNLILAGVEGAVLRISLTSLVAVGAAPNPNQRAAKM